MHKIINLLNLLVMMFIQYCDYQTLCCRCLSPTVCTVCTYGGYRVHLNRLRVTFLVKRQRVFVLNVLTDEYRVFNVFIIGAGTKIDFDIEPQCYACYAAYRSFVKRSKPYVWVNICAPVHSGAFRLSENNFGFQNRA